MPARTLPSDTEATAAAGTRDRDLTTSWIGFSRPARRASRIRVSALGLIATSAFGSVHGVLHSTAFVAFRSVVLGLAIVFWLGLAYWTYRDARRRVDDPWLVGT